MNLPTTYIGAVAYVERTESLKLIASRIKRNPSERRRVRR
jgi:hypothetical protein